MTSNTNLLSVPFVYTSLDVRSVSITGPKISNSVSPSFQMYTLHLPSYFIYLFKWFTVAHWQSTGCTADCSIRVSDNRKVPRYQRQLSAIIYLKTHFFQLAFQSPSLLPSCASDSPSADHCARLYSIFTYLLTGILALTVQSINQSINQY